MSLPSREAPVAELKNERRTQSLAAGDEALEVNVMGLTEAPWATSSPRIWRALPESNLTVTPGSLMRVTPENTTTFPVTWNGLSNADHVLSSEMGSEADVPAYTGEMEMKARSRNRATIVRRSEPMKLRVLPI